MTNGSPRQVRRRENLRKLIGENGGQAQVAVEIGTPKTHLSAILAGRRGVGDALAQKLERHFDKPAGWMDGNYVTGARSAATEKLADAIDALSERQRDRLIKTVWELVEVAREVDQMAAESNSRKEIVESGETISSKRMVG